MGCTSAKQRRPDLMKMNTVTGQLKVTVTSAHITHETSVFKMDPYVILKLSNQEEKSKTIFKGDKNPTFNETFTFYINSCFKQDGRNLQVKVMDQNKVGSDKDIGYGICDLDPIINLKKAKEPFRCFVSYDYKPAGFVNLIAEFVEDQSKTLSFRFETATIKRKTSTFGNMNCWVHIVVGEEELKTEKKADTKEHSPTWFQETVAFNVSDSIPQCKITLFDDNKIVGSTTIPMKDLLKTNDEQTFNQELMFEGKSAGTLVFQSIVGTNPIFSLIKAIHTKITLPVIPPKMDGAEGQKKQEEEPKKQEVKQEQGKKEQIKEEKQEGQEKEEKQEEKAVNPENLEA